MLRISVKEAASKVGVSESLIYQWCHELRFPHLRLGKAGRRGKILILESDLASFLEELKVEAGPVDTTTPLQHITRK